MDAGTGGSPKADPPDDSGPSAFTDLKFLRRLGPRHALDAAISVTRRFSAPPDQVFGSWLDPEIAGRWLFATAGHPLAHVEIDARVEGSFRLLDRRHGEIVEYAGTYLEIAPHRRLVFTLSMDERASAATRVTVVIVPLKNGCELTLAHENVPHDLASHVEERWTGVLYGLEATLDEARDVHCDRE